MSKFLLLFIVFSLGVSISPILAQKKLRPSTHLALLTVSFINPVNKKAVPLKSFTLEGQLSKKKFEAQTNHQGQAIILLPINEIYLVHLSNWDNFAQIEIPKGAYQVHNIPLPFHSLPTDSSTIGIKIPVHLHLLQANGLPSQLTEILSIKSGKTKQTYTIKTNKQGIATLDLPINCDYVLSLNNAPFYYKFKLPNRIYSKWKEDIIFERKKGLYKYPSIKNALFNFIFENMENKPCAGEKFWLKSNKTNKKYEGITNKDGIAQILAPINDIYSFNAVDNLNFGSKNVQLQQGNNLIIETIFYQSKSTFQQKKHKKNQEKIAHSLDSIARIKAHKLTRKIDSLNNINEKKVLELFAKNDLPIPVKKKTFRIKKTVLAKVAIYEKQLQVNPSFFEDKKKPILAILKRFDKQWDNKVIVTDITESMNPYLEEILIWHALRVQQKNKGKYLFFNDGDKKTAAAKKIGKTKGIYTCQGNYEDLPLVIKTLQTAIHSGLGGGEPTENDLEAVLAGIQQQQKAEEVILIADAFSRVRDISLLSQIKSPIRIILCGVEEKNSYYQNTKLDINEQYLTIAHRSGGSLHTLKSDIWNLSAKKEGEIVQIGQAKYILKNKQFIKLLY